MDFDKKRRLSRLGVMVLAAVLVEVISIAQYGRVKAAMEEEMGVRARVVLGAMGADVGHMMELTEDGKEVLSFADRIEHLIHCNDIYIYDFDEDVIG